VVISLDNLAKQFHMTWCHRCHSVECDWYYVSGYSKRRVAKRRVQNLLTCMSAEELKAVLDSLEDSERRSRR